MSFPVPTQRPIRAADRVRTAEDELVDTLNDMTDVSVMCMLCMCVVHGCHACFRCVWTSRMYMLYISVTYACVYMCVTHGHVVRGLDIMFWYV